MHIRPLEASDSIGEITSLLHRAYARLGAMKLNYTAVDQTPEVTASRVSVGSSFVAEVNCKLVGTIVVRPSYVESQCDYFRRPNVAVANQLAVDPDHQGTGVGRLLLQRAELWAAESGFQELAMDTAEQATHLIRLYSRLGYQHVSHVQWPGKVYRSVVLSKRLGENA